MSGRRFSPSELEEFRATKYMYIRSGDHRFIAVWVVVVGDRVVVRSWNDKPGGWYRAFLKEPRGHVRLGDREVAVCAIPMRSKMLNDSADAAYGSKYTTKANAKYVKGLVTAKRKVTTLELMPA